jgi:hypothetical protein
VRNFPLSALLRHRRTTAWIALVAMLFGAVSPLIAATLFRDQPGVAARILGAPLAAESAAEQVERLIDEIACHYEPAGDTRHRPSTGDRHGPSTHHDTHDESKHAAHAVFCSFCLPASAGFALPAAAALPPVSGAESYGLAGPARHAAQATPHLHRVRGPPALFS